MTGLAPTRLRLEMDRVPLWRSPSNANKSNTKLAAGGGEALGAKSRAVVGQYASDRHAQRGEQPPRRLQQTAAGDAAVGRALAQPVEHEHKERDADRARNARLGRPSLNIGEGSIIERAILDKDCRVGKKVRLVNEGGKNEADGSHVKTKISWVRAAPRAS